MSARFWIFIAAILGGSAVAAGAIGAHALGGAAALDASWRSYNAAQYNHAIHALALLGVALLIRQPEGHRAVFASWALQIAAAAFAIGVVLFSGGIYAHVAAGITSLTKLVPVGGTVLIAAWVALAIAALGIRF